MTAQQFVSLIAALGIPAIVGTIFTWLNQRKGSSAEATRTILGASQDVVAMLVEAVERLETEVTLCHEERDADRLRITILETELARYKMGKT